MRALAAQKEWLRRVASRARADGGGEVAELDNAGNEVTSHPYRFELNQPTLGSVNVFDAASGTFVGAALVLKDARLESKFARPHPDGLIVMAGRQAFVIAPSLRPLPGGGTQLLARLATAADLECAGLTGAAGWPT